jgi:lipid II:glycine glycyltransferase (peptidoglycan interpeptide bridge formation enzyme)
VTSPEVHLRVVDPAKHLRFVEERSGSFLQTPAWGRLKTEWRSESLGWFSGEIMIGAGLVLYRSLPRIGRSLAYLPEGPVTDWSAPTVLDVLRTLRDHVTERGAFGLRLGPTVPVRRWHAETVKSAIADDEVRSLRNVAPDLVHEDGVRLRAELHRLGFRHLASDAGFAAGQPEFVFQLPLAGRTEADLLGGMNQLWRRNIKKSAKFGVHVKQGSAADLPAFHEAYVETARRDQFTPRPLSYFSRMLDVMTAEDPDRIRLYLACHDSDLVAATLFVRVGAHAWYSYGASTAAKREVQGSTAVQWQMMRDALAVGASVYDLRGITDTVAADDPHAGLIRFKLGTGGEAVEYVGEWDLPLNRVLYKAFDVYLRRRG